MRDVLQRQRTDADARPRPQVLPAPEFTMEANPGTIDTALLDELAAAGVTRLSLGVQSFSRRLREASGSAGRADRKSRIALAAIRSARAGRSGTSIWCSASPASLGRKPPPTSIAAVAAGPTHISLYDLTYTPSYRDAVRVSAGAGRRRGCGRTSPRRTMPAASSRLVEAGILRATRCPISPCPAMSAGTTWGTGEGRTIWASAPRPFRRPAASAARTPARSADYLAGGPAEVEILDERTRLWEKAMLGLRTSEGVDETAVRPVLDPRGRRPSAPSGLPGKALW